MSNQDPAEKAARAVFEYCHGVPGGGDIAIIAAIIRHAYADHENGERKKLLRGFDAKTKRWMQRRKPLDAVGIPLSGGKGKVDYS
jgi:hypothetical protein